MSRLAKSSPVAIDPKRVAAFRDCLLNTCVRAARPYFSNLTLSNCTDSYQFCQMAYQWLQLPLFSKEVEPAMALARQHLMIEMETKEYSA